MNTQSFKSLIKLSFLCLIASMICQLLFQQPFLGLSIVLASNSAWHLYQLKRFDNWLQQKNKGKADPPHTIGLWGSIFDRAYRLQKKTIKARKQLESHIKRAQSSANALHDGVIIVNQTGQLEWWNETAATLLELKSKEDKQRPITHLIRHPDFVDYFNEGQYEHPHELDSPNNDNIRLQIEITRFGQNERILLIRNVTNIYKLEQMRTDFIANVSHELRTPLTVLIGYLEAFENTSATLPKPLARGVQHMREQSKRMEALITDLLHLSRLEQSSKTSIFSSIHILNLLKSLTEEVDILLQEKGISIELNINPQLHLMGNETDMHSAFLNLITNAIKYSPEKSCINISSQTTDNGEAIIEFKDHGIGIDPAFIPRLTERFFRVDASRATSSGGTGLGLAIVKHVLLRHQAKLIIQSQPHIGSSFICQFPEERVIKPGHDPINKFSALPLPVLAESGDK